MQILITGILGNCQINADNSNWKKIAESKIPTEEFRGLKCSDSLNFMIWGTYWASGAGFFFRRSTDAGKTWYTVYKDSGYYYSHENQKEVPDVRAVAYPTPNLFIAVGDSGLILRTTNGGDTWEKTINPKSSGQGYTDIKMLDDKYGVLIGCRYICADTESYIFETQDGGETWSDISYKSPLWLLNIIDNEHACGVRAWRGKDSTDQVKLIWALDDWKNFDTLDYPRSRGINVIKFLNKDEGWLAGGDQVF